MCLAALPKMAERTLTLGSFAGIPGLDSWLISWIAGPKSLVSPARALKLGISLCSAAVSQHGALAGMLSGNERLAAQNVSRINAVKALLKQRGIPYLEPDTVAFLVADVSSIGGGDRVAAAGTRGGVRLTSGSEFGAPNCIRIGAPSSRFEQGIARLESVLKSMEKV
jgi:aspartate/methionine/tyrosine aminotransferase